MGRELVTQGFELGTNLGVIVNFAIKDDAPFTSIFENGLIAALQIDDLEACGATGEGIGRKCALLVGSPVMQRGHGFLNAALGCFSIFMGEAGNSAQALGLSEHEYAARTTVAGEINGIGAV